MKQEESPLASVAKAVVPEPEPRTAAVPSGAKIPARV